jgi:hypothetical protein
MRNQGEIIRLCREAAQLKNELDLKKNTCSWPSSFVRILLPFSNRSNEHLDMRVVRTFDSSFAIGGHFMGYKSPVDPQKVMDDLNSSAVLSSDPANKNYYVDAGVYGQIGYLPLYFAVEGKNRVPLFQKHKRCITAWVAPVPYAIECLEVVKDRLSENYWVRAPSGDDDIISEMLPVHFPEITVPLLIAGGAQLLRERIDSEFNDHWLDSYMREELKG